MSRMSMIFLNLSIVIEQQSDTQNVVESEYLHILNIPFNTQIEKQYTHFRHR